MTQWEIKDRLAQLDKLRHDAIREATQDFWRVHKLEVERLQKECGEQGHKFYFVDTNYWHYEMHDCEYCGYRETRQELRYKDRCIRLVWDAAGRCWRVSGYDIVFEGYHDVDKRFQEAMDTYLGSADRTRS